MNLGIESRRKVFVSNFNNQDSTQKEIKSDLKNDLHKGHIAESLLYGSHKEEGISFKKTGKEIKEKLSTQKDILISELTKHSEKLDEKLQICGILPDKEPELYGYREVLKTKGVSIPKEYSYDLINNVRKEGPQSKVVKTIIGNIQAPLMEESKEEVSSSNPNYIECFYNYNDCVRKVVEILSEIELIKTLESNLIENKEYTLNFNQISMLGF